jgi:hypothetical protein
MCHACSIVESPRSGIKATMLRQPGHGERIFFAGWTARALCGAGGYFFSAVVPTFTGERATITEKPGTMLVSGQVTQWLVRLSEGDEEALEGLMPLLYDELRSMARLHLRNERSGHTLSPTALFLG